MRPLDVIRIRSGWKCKHERHFTDSLLAGPVFCDQYLRNRSECLHGIRDLQLRDRFGYFDKEGIRRLEE